MVRYVSASMVPWMRGLPQRDQDVASFRRKAAELGIATHEYAAATALLTPLATHHPLTVAHCLRVGTQAARIAQRLEDDASLAFLGGATHDIGKLGVPRSILDATTLSSNEHLRFIVPHVRLGYEMIRELLPEAAEAMKYHHAFRRRNPYPDPLPMPDITYAPERAARHKRVGRLIALADYTDAMRTRNNDKFGDNPLTAEQRLRFLHEDHADIARELELLLLEGIITL